MSYKKVSGFTIIETMLFLAITGLLVAGILGSAGSSINTQRYKDSVSSLQAYFQKQFSEATNVSNDQRTAMQNFSCDANATVTNGGSNILPRGQSDCLILGKFITSVNTSFVGTNKLNVATVVGVPTAATASDPSNDTLVLATYNIKVIPNNVISFDVYDIEWGSTLKIPGSGNDSKFSILLLKSPTSGVTRAYIDSDSVVSNPKTLVNSSYLLPAETVSMCVNSGNMYGGEKMAVIVNANATSAAGVETLSSSGLTARFGVNFKC